MHQTTVRVAEGALDANQTIAEANRADFDAAGVTVINLMSAPGAGKTTLLERALEDTGDVRVGVLEGDVRGSLETVGEDRRWMISSVTEGDDKPLKYPLMFRTCELVVINKIDLLPHVDFSMERFLANLDQVNPSAQTLEVSARTGEGVDAWWERLLGVAH